jgi:hypothetical protein
VIREKRETNPDQKSSRDIIFGTEIWGPTIEIHAFGAHEIWGTSENQIPIFFVLKQKYKKILTTKGG